MNDILQALVAVGTGTSSIHTKKDQKAKLAFSCKTFLSGVDREKQIVAPSFPNLQVLVPFPFPRSDMELSLPPFLELVQWLSRLTRGLVPLPHLVSATIQLCLPPLRIVACNLLKAVKENKKENKIYDKLPVNADDLKEG